MTAFPLTRPLPSCRNSYAVPMITPQYRSILESRRAELTARLETIGAPEGGITLEVGCGHGHFLTAYARANPAKTCVGIDISTERVDRADRKRERAALPTLHFIQAEARFFLETLPARFHLTEIFILFPDPWPKLRHNKHRLLQRSFLTQLAERATPGCPLYFRTDFLPYASAAEQELQEAPEWELVPDAPWPFEFVTVFQERAETYRSLVARCLP